MMAGSGAVLGALFDIYRELAGRLRPPRWLVPLLDALYWLAAIVLVFRTLLYSNDGQVRFYVFLGLLLGGWLYFRLASRMTIRLVHIGISVVQTLIRVFKTLFSVLIVKPLKLLYRLLLLTIGFLWMLTMFLVKIVLQLIYPCIRLLAWLTKPLWKRVAAQRWWKSLVERVGKWANAVRRLFRKDG